MSDILLLLTFAVGLVGGPFVVAKVWPERSRCVGDTAAGECGMSPVLWGAALGVLLGYLGIAALIVTSGDDLTSPSTSTQVVAMLFVFMAALAAPLVIYGFHTWKWNASGLEFIGVFRRRTVLWKDVTSVRRVWRTSWKLETADGIKLNTSRYMLGQRVVIAALCINRSDLAPQVTAALEAERA